VERPEGIVGFSLCTGTFVVALTMYFLIAREFNPSWLTFISSSFDVTMVSVALALFLFLDKPHAAVNSRVVFESYFLAIASTSLRYDKRVCITAGALACAEYFAIVYIADRHWDLNNASYAPFPYGMFDWASEISRLIQMMVAAALSLLLVARSSKLLRMATSDPLTGLFNRGYIDDRLNVELSRARRYRQQLTLAVIDVDRFKSLNDTYGHTAGDAVLRKIGSVLRHTFRQSDTAGRYGGEEFVVILPETDLAAAQQKMESLREMIAAMPMELEKNGKPVSVTISAGLAGLPEDGHDAAELFALADERMFLAKSEGRNRVNAGTAEAVLN
jgi:two-component system, cell cycle response regulator